MRLTLLQLLTVFLIVAVTASASAGTINISGSVVYPPGFQPDGSVNLVGDRGFVLQGVAFGNVMDQILAPANQCSIDRLCSPGSTINLHVAASGNDFPGSATLDGVAYPIVNDPGGLGAHARIAFTGEVVAPDFGSSPTAVVTAPVDFDGGFGISAFVEGNQLIAAAHATLTLQEANCLPGFPFCSGPGWQYEGIRYDLTPTPEPSTLLLFGTAMAGLGLRWRRRRQN